MLVWFDYRWIKFEEDVEEGGNRWSKPHVATLSLHSLFELRSMILNGTICLDMAATTLDDICELTLDNMINANVLTFDKKAFVKDAILKKHHHQYEGSKDKKEGGSNLSKLPLIRSLAEIGRNHSSSKSKTTLTIYCFNQCLATLPVILMFFYTFNILLYSLHFGLWFCFRFAFVYIFWR